MRRLIAVSAVSAVLMMLVGVASADAIRFGAETLLPDDPRTHFSRAVNFAPAAGQRCAVNPPRFRWQYHPTEPGAGGDYLFRFQIAANSDFKNPLVDVETELNFYNTIKPLDGVGPFYWRIGYRPRTEPNAKPIYSTVRSFTIASDAAIWDRSSLAKPDLSSAGHPRILFNPQTLPKLRTLIATDPESKVIFQQMRSVADLAIASSWWAHVPKSDLQAAEIPYLDMAQQLTVVAFCWRITGDGKYAGVLDRAVRMARYPKGGRASPEAAGGESNEDSTQITEFLALLFDWLYSDLSEAQRRDFIDSLDWRIDHFLRHFVWRRVNDGIETMPSHALGIRGSSHGYEGFFDTFPAALAIHEYSASARLCFEIGVNFMAGVGSSHGFDEAHNEGPGYGNSKLAWQVNAISYLDSVFPDFNIGANPWLRRLGEFFRAQTPVGLKHAPWGHGSNRAEYFEYGHRKSYRKLAFLTGDGRYLANYQQYASVTDDDLMRPWIECALPLWRARPAPVVAEDAVRLFPLAGWVTALSGPPSDPRTYRDGVGMIFACRPRGAYSHAFNCDNSFHLFGYGQDLSHAAGSSGYEPYAFHGMSHNTILVDGLGQAQPRGVSTPGYGRMLAFAATADGTAVYWCGDATKAYPRQTFLPRHWWGKLADVYTKRDASHLRRANRHVLFVRRKYFVILDDLAADKPATWTWLYHVLKAQTFDLDTRTGSSRYTVGDVQVLVTHLSGGGKLDVLDLQGDAGYRNPLTGEDYSGDSGRADPASRYSAAHNLWLTTRGKYSTWRFMCVIYPIRPGGQAPKIERVDDLTVRVAVRDEVDVISFDPSSANQATIIVDLAAIAPAGLH